MMYRGSWVWRVEVEAIGPAGWDLVLVAKDSAARQKAKAAMHDDR